MNKKGFTLVELLVVMIIIAILTVMSIPMYNGFRMNARNSTALNDIRHLRDMLENYYAAYLVYPSGLFEGDDASGGVWSNPGGGGNKRKVMVIKLRPSSEVTFYYQVDPIRENYVIATKHTRGNRIYSTSNLVSMFLQYEDETLIGKTGADSGVAIPQITTGTTDSDVALSYLNSGWVYVSGEPVEEGAEPEAEPTTE
jgi:prepilin-type N-terminal cleavage/methylation domain-containing protein